MHLEIEKPSDAERGEAVVEFFVYFDFFILLGV